MNILYTITWPASSTEDLPRQFYEQLREAVASGISFPFDCPYEVALLRAVEPPDATPPGSHWAVAVLAMLVTTIEIEGSQYTLPELENWFSQCIPGGLPPGSVIQPSEASQLKLASELSTTYAVVANFGTFVGEPDLEAPPDAPIPPMPFSPETEALKALVGQPLSPQAQKALAGPALPKPPARTAPPLTADSNTLSSCLRIALLAGGVFLIPLSMLLGGLLALGQFSSDPSSGSASTSSIAELILMLACCPVPVLVLGIGLILLGIFVPRWIKKNQPRAGVPLK